METQDFLKTKVSKILLGVIVVSGVISLAKFGNMFGQWLLQLIN